MKRHNIELDPVSNRRLICLLALTAGICFSVFVEISCSEAPPFTEATAPPPLFSFSMYNISFSGQPAAPQGLGASITAPLSYNAIFDDYGAWILAGSSFPIFSIQLFVISLLIWLHGPSNCLWGFWRNRFQSFSNRFKVCSASSTTTTSSIQKFGFDFNINYSIRFHSKTNTATHQLSQLSGQEIVESPMLANAPAFEETQTIRPLE